MYAAGFFSTFATGSSARQRLRKPYGLLRTAWIAVSARCLAASDSAGLPSETSGSIASRRGASTRTIRDRSLLVTEPSINAERYLDRRACERAAQQAVPTGGAPTGATGRHDQR